MNENLREVYQKICAYSPDDSHSCLSFTQRLARENRWTHEYATRVVREYKRFMFLAIAAGHEVTPSDQVDQAWHLHLVYTRQYWDDFCANVLGKRVHHGPTKGGSSEANRFRNQYEQTLASYQQWFHEIPPHDIWPPTEDRFAAASELVWVNQATAWIVPKPWSVQRAGPPKSWLLAAGVAPLLLGATNPLNFSGKEFLTFYAGICATGLLGAIVLRYLLRSDDHSAEQADLSPYEVACLAGGVKRVVQSSLAALVADGRLRVTENLPRKLGPISLGTANYLLHSDSSAESHEAVESAVAQAAMSPTGAKPEELIDSAQSAAEEIELRLQAKGLLESPESFRAARWWPTLLLSGVWLLGAAKVLVGLSRGKPVGFLLVSLIALTIVGLIFQKRPLRTRSGERLFKRLEGEHEALRSTPSEHTENLPTNDMILAAGLFGIAAIDHAEVSKLQAAIQTVPPKSGGAFSCGGGCGGGGCGGGGCGGGCGGCGG